MASDGCDDIPCWTREFSGADSASFTSIVTGNDPDLLTVPETLLSYLNRASTVSDYLSGIDLNACTKGGVAQELWHEEQRTLTLLTTSMRKPVFVDGPQENAMQNRKSIIQKLDPITSADNHIILPSATPGIYLSISSLSETALKATVTPDVLVPLRAKTHEQASPYSSSNQSPKELPQGRPANDRKDEPTIIFQQAGVLASAQGPEHRPVYGPPSRTQQTEKSLPAPFTLP